jgi:RNA polymerase sigma factor (TIGR02999 family)
MFERLLLTTTKTVPVAATKSEECILGDPFEQLFSRDYAQILALARSRLSRESAPISTLTLAHELYLNLRGRQGLKFDSREQFLAYSSRAMRSLLVDMARERLAKKRSSDLLPLTYGIEVADSDGTPEQVLALEDALERLGKIDARLLKVAELRVILGMDIADTASALGLSEPTIKRDWQRAKAYLYEQLGGDS